MTQNGDQAVIDCPDFGAVEQREVVGNCIEREAEASNEKAGQFAHHLADHVRRQFSIERRIKFAACHGIFDHQAKVAVTGAADGLIYGMS